MNFASELKKLNKAQRLAVETIEGPVMVVAGPGTGKTQVLTLRIANILKKTDTPPESVLALTFTESAAASMRQRLVEIMGGSNPASTRGGLSTRGGEAYKVSIKTIHGFCNEVIQNYPEEFSELSGTTNITEVDQIRLVRKLLDLREYPLLRSFGDPYRNVRDIISAISDLKREGKSPKEFEKIVAREEKNFEMIEDLYHNKGAHKGEKKGKYQTQEKQIARLGELSKLYAAYQVALRKQRSYDYDDMIMEVAAALETNKALRYTLQEKYLYLLIDEHQDTNQAQNRVIELLASFHESPNLFVVGDEKQAIYRFQGASIENFTYFQKRFKGAKVIPLTENYRSHQTILDAAFDLALSSPKGVVHEKLIARAKHPKKQIQLVSFSAPDVENYFLASDIARKIKGGTKPEEIAVLYRDNKDSVPIARMLERVSVPFSIQSDEDVFQDYDIKKLLLLFEAVRNFGKDYALIPALYIDFLKIAPLDVAQLLDTARQYRESVFTIIRDKKALQKVVPESAENISELYEKLSLWKAMSKNDSPLTVFEAIIRDSGFLSYATSSVHSQELMAKVHALFDELKSLLQSRRETMFNDFLEHLELVREHRVRLKLKANSSKLSAVQLMTAHKAKGMEFEVVYITNAIHTHWGSRRNRDFIKLPVSVYSHSNILQNVGMSDDGEEDADERNIFYVALTRAKKEVIITYSEKNAEGKAQLISEFTNTIRPELVERASTEKIEKEFAKYREIEFVGPVIVGAKEGAKEHQKWVQKRFLEKGLSVSALNNYLECPNKFYFLNLVGFPEAPNKFALFGNAAHAALKFLSQEVNAKRKVTKPQFLKYFERALGREPISEREFEDMVAKGGKGLVAYFDAHVKSWPVGSFPEYSIRGVKVGPIEVRGQLDRVDLIDAGGTQVRVVDYKTGRIKTRNEIAGKTRSASSGQAAGNFYRQLTFYKLLIERGTQWKMAEGEIDFIEPDAKGNFKREVFAPSEAEVRELEEEIGRVSAEISKGEFKSCEEKDCRYCMLKDL